LIRVLVVVVIALVAAGEAAACVCLQQPLEERLDDADAAVVGRLVSERTRDLQGASQRLITVEVTQRVKGDVGETIVVRSPSGSDCDLPRAEGQRIGLLLERAPDGGWLGNLCGMVGAGELVAEGGEPRGGVIKVVLGVLILGLVLSWALRRRARGTRPDIPGAPEP
jgi:hypothetical protein